MSGLADVADQVRHCHCCRLSSGRTLAVPGEGPENAAIMLIGEGPGYHEDQQGRPFVGPAGQFLESLLHSINLRRSEVFITNVVKCRPPENRDPMPDELAACRPHLDQQSALIKPKLVVTLGRFSMQIAFSGVTISSIHGTAKRVGDIVYMPMFHPAAALHQQRYRSLIEQDFLKIPALLAELRSVEPEDGLSQSPEQLSLF